MHATSFEGEPLPCGTGRVKGLAGGGHDRRAGHSTLRTPRLRMDPSQTYPLCFPPAADCAGSQGLLPMGSPASTPARTVSRRSCASQTQQAASSPAVGDPQASCPRMAFVCPPPPTGPVPLPVPALRHGSVSPPTCPPSTAVPSHLAPSTLPTGASLGLQDGNGQLLCPRAGAHWGFCVLHPPGPWSPWVETAG